jgi:hypothetical protein
MALMARSKRSDTLVSIRHGGDDAYTATRNSPSRRRQLEPPGRPLQQVGSGSGAQRQIEVLSVARHRADKDMSVGVMMPGGAWPRAEISPQVGLCP